MTTPTDTLADTLRLLRTRLAQIRPTAEDAVALRRRIIDPMLDALGWSVEDGNRVSFAVEVEGQTLDYVLKLQGTPLVGITATPDGESPISLESLANAGIPWHLTTTGHRWVVRSSLDGQIILDVVLDGAHDQSAAAAAETIELLSRDIVIRGSLTRLLRLKTSPGQSLPRVLPPSPLPMGRPEQVDSAVRRRGIPQGLALELSPEEIEWLQEASHNTHVLYHAWRQALAKAFPAGLTVRVHAHHVTARSQGRIVASAAVEDAAIITWLPASIDWVERLDGATDVTGQRHPGSGNVEVRCTSLSDVGRLAGPMNEIQATAPVKTRSR